MHFYNNYNPTIAFYKKNSTVDNTFNMLYSIFQNFIGKP